MPTNKESKLFIEKFKGENPIYNCGEGAPNGQWKWLPYLNGIDLRVGHSSKKSAEMHRANAAKEAWAMHVHMSFCSYCNKKITPYEYHVLECCTACAANF